MQAAIGAHVCSSFYNECHVLTCKDKGVGKVDCAVVGAVGCSGIAVEINCKVVSLFVSAAFEAGLIFSGLYILLCIQRWLLYGLKIGIFASCLCY